MDGAGEGVMEGMKSSKGERIWRASREAGEEMGNCGTEEWV